MIGELPIHRNEEIHNTSDHCSQTSIGTPSIESAHTSHDGIQHHHSAELCGYVPQVRVVLVKAHYVVAIDPGHVEEIEDPNPQLSGVCLPWRRGGAVAGSDAE